MWKRDFPSIYNALKEEWSPAIKPIITALQGEISQPEKTMKNGKKSDFKNFTRAYSQYEA